jgi:hypothetical protein
MEMFKGYDPGKFYDEMFGADSAVRGHCAPLLRRFGQLDNNSSSSSERGVRSKYRRGGSAAFGIAPDDLSLWDAGDSQSEHAAPGAADVSLAENAVRADPGDSRHVLAAFHGLVSEH